MQEYSSTNDRLNCMTDSIYCRRSLIKHSLIKECVIYYTYVNYRMVCKHRMMDSKEIRVAYRIEWIHYIWIIYIYKSLKENNLPEIHT